MNSGQNRVLSGGSAVGSEKGTEFPLLEHKIRSKAGVKPIKAAASVIIEDNESAVV